ncbi:MAG: HEAT repeat domain-containing protein [Gemmataceae bacterium]|nr:HEAT repeat domain-containing protein [Gemmataceae bacterium]MDW8266214.1 HEAT repeat domain-containing protein [Gemmataceae bacterium]
MDPLLVTLVVMTVLLGLALMAGILVGRRLYRRPAVGGVLSPVTRQHLDLFQGGQLSEDAVETAKQRFRSLLERGEIDAVEASLRPGTHFVVHVRALTELGTDDAGQILERQLLRRHTDDQLEQSWYWIDLASGLRSLNRPQSLPHLLRCAADDIPLGHFLAAETVCFLGFASYLRDVNAPLGQAALRVLHRALEGLRYGVQPHVITEGRLGEAVERLWDHRPERTNPLVVRVFVEALRQLRRAPHAERLIADDVSEQEAFSWQISRLAALEPVLEDYLAEAREELPRLLAATPPAEHPDILRALHDLRAEAGDVVLRWLQQPGYPHAELALEVLAWSRDPQVGPALRRWAATRLPMDQRALCKPRSTPPRRPSVPADVPYAGILRALRGHASPETEGFLTLAALDWDPTYRVAAVASLGWWEPWDRSEVLRCLRQALRDGNSDVRRAARAALARLGECQALQWFRAALASTDHQRRHEAIQAIAAEGLVLLWPDVDELAEAEDLEIAQHAREALERLDEDLRFRRD